MCIRLQYNQRQTVQLIRSYSSDSDGGEGGGGRGILRSKTKEIAHRPVGTSTLTWFAQRPQGCSVDISRYNAGYVSPTRPTYPPAHCKLASFTLCLIPHWSLLSNYVSYFLPSRPIPSRACWWRSNNRVIDLCWLNIPRYDFPYVRQTMITGNVSPTG